MRTRSDGGCLHSSRSIVTRPFSQEQQLIEHVIINHSMTRIVLYEGVINVQLHKQRGFEGNRFEDFGIFYKIFVLYI